MVNLSVVSTAISLIPTIINVIKSIEEAVPAGGAGAQKLEAVKNILIAADSTIADIWPQVQGLVTTLVTLFNGTIWKKQ